MTDKFYKGAVIQTGTLFPPISRVLCPKGPLKDGLLDIYLTMFFGEGLSANTLALRVIFFGKCL